MCAPDWKRDCKVCAMIEHQKQPVAHNVKSRSASVTSILSAVAGSQQHATSSTGGVSRVGPPETPRPNILREIVEAELALWTFAMTALFAYVQRRRVTNGAGQATTPVVSLLVVSAVVVGITTALSSALLVAIVVGRLLFRFPSAGGDQYAEWLSTASPKMSQVHGGGSHGGSEQGRRPRRDSSRGSQTSLSSSGSDDEQAQSAPFFFWRRRRSLDRRFASIYRQPAKSF